MIRETPFLSIRDVFMNSLYKNPMINLTYISMYIDAFFI